MYTYVWLLTLFLCCGVNALKSRNKSCFSVEVNGNEVVPNMHTRGAAHVSCAFLVLRTYRYQVPCTKVRNEYHRCTVENYSSATGGLMMDYLVSMKEA